MSNYKFTEYDKIVKLGEGTYGSVYKVQHRTTGEVYALKKITRMTEEEGVPVNAIREAVLLKKLHHKNVIKVKEVRYNVQTGKIYFLMECLDYDLRSFMEKRALPLAMIKSLAYQLLSGLDYLHSQNILHRDVKPQNLLVNASTGVLKICDFGLARPLTLPLGPLTTAIQTLWYRAPEILLGCKTYSVGVDIWSAGCVIAELAIGQPLFKTSSEIGLLFLIFQVLGTVDESNSLYTAPHFSQKFPRFRENRLTEYLKQFSLDDDLIELLMLMLVTDPEKRLSLKNAQSHRFFSS